MKKTLENILIVRPPLKSIASEEGVITSVDRLNNPPYSEAVVGRIFSNELTNPKIEFVDLAYIEDSQENTVIECGKRFKYADMDVRKITIGKPKESIADKLSRADTLALTSHFTSQSNSYFELIKYAKKVNPEIRIIVGGNDANARAEHYISCGADIIVFGDGESIVKKLRESPLIDSGLATNPNRVKSEQFAVPDLSLIALEKYKVKKFFTPVNPGEIDTITHKTNIPLNPALPDTTLVDAMTINPIGPAQVKIFGNNLFPGQIRAKIGNNYRKEPAEMKAMYLQTSRGCIHTCDFCRGAGIPYRFQSPEQIESILEMYKQAGIELLVNTEDNLAARLKMPEGREAFNHYFDSVRIHNFFLSIANGIEMGLLTKKDGSPDPDLINNVFKREEKGYGVAHILYPLERPAATNTYAKLKPFEKQKEMMQSLADIGLPSMTVTTIIFPDDSKELIDETEKRLYEVRDIFEGSKTQVAFGIYTLIPLPGTRLYTKSNPDISIVQYPELWDLKTPVQNGKFFNITELYHKIRAISAELNMPSTHLERKISYNL